MPVYTYRCENCGHEFDKRQSFSDNPLKACPNCRKHTLQKVYFPAGVAFKGSGFYVTDRRDSKNGAAKPAKGKENGTKETKVEKKTETPKPETPKPAAKKED
jgi:putative FmdB family regulatory protein